MLSGAKSKKALAALRELKGHSIPITGLAFKDEKNKKIHVLALDSFGIKLPKKDQKIYKCVFCGFETYLPFTEDRETFCCLECFRDSISQSEENKSKHSEC